MKLTKQTLKQIIKEELNKVLNENENQDYTAEIIKTLGLQDMQTDGMGRFNFDQPAAADEARDKLLQLAKNKIDQMASNGFLTAKGRKELESRLDRNSIMPGDDAFKFAEESVKGHYYKNKSNNNPPGHTVDRAHEELRKFFKAAAGLERKMASTAR